MDQNRAIRGKVKGRTARFEWMIPHFFELRLGDYTSSTVNHFNMNLYLGIHKYSDGTHCVWLRRELLTAGVPESVRFTIVCKTPGGGERDVARDQTFPRNFHWWCRDMDCPSRKPSGDVTFTCTLWKGDSPPAEGVSRETQTEGAHRRYDVLHSKEIEELRQKFRVWLQQPEEGDCIRILRREHFAAKKEDPPCPIESPSSPARA